MKKIFLKLIAIVIVLNVTGCATGTSVDYEIYNKYQRAFYNVKDQESYTLVEDIDADIILNEEKSKLGFTNMLKYENNNNEPVYNLTVNIDDTDMSIDSYFMGNNVYVKSAQDTMLVDVTKVFIKYELINFATSNDKANLKSAEVEHDKESGNDIVTLFFEGQSYVKYVEELSDLGLTDFNVEEFYPTEIKVVATIDNEGMLINEKIFFNTYSEVKVKEELKHMSLSYVANTDFTDVNNTAIEIPNLEGTTQIDMTQTLNFIRDFKSKIITPETLKEAK